MRILEALVILFTGMILVYITIGLLLLLGTLSGCSTIGPMAPGAPSYPGRATINEVESADPFTDPNATTNPDWGTPYE